MAYYSQFPPPPPPPPPPTKRTLGIGLMVAGVAVIAATVAIAISVTGDDKDATAAEAPVTQAVSLADQDAAFYRWVVRNPWSQNGNTQQDWTDLAGAMCGAFDRDATYNDIATILVSEMNEFTITDAENFVRESVKVYCPEYLDRVN